MPAELEIASVSKSFGPVLALDDVGLSVRAGELLTILGPSGSGKTTLLRVIAGYETPDRGAVRLRGADITALPAARRNIGMVFQNYALFPHMTVGGNIAFPLQMRRRKRAEIAEIVEAALRLVDLAGYAARYPSQLSGGQQQRVALARAVVFEPLLLLLDEPFGALDRKLREAMQLEVRRLQRRLGITTLFITHDQEEALILSDRVAVMNRGRIEQVGAPTEIYHRPQSAFVADFVGESNIFRGHVAASAEGASVIVLDGGVMLDCAQAWQQGARVGAMIRPERLTPADVPGRNVLEGTIAEAAFIGTAWKCALRLGDGATVLVRLPTASATGLPASGARLAVRVPPESIHLFALE
ncbi:MAG TPA: ABC transporter ATP-binding protein [Acetobacteraceae bacterium]|nr:ABC transporter ATP-binding protein [Acetobacteraceae bacterium]